jgi:hypothetical protein
MPSTSPASIAINTFKAEFTEFQTEHAGAIAQLEVSVAAAGSDGVLEDLLWDMVSDLKGLLSTAAANSCSDNAAEQEREIASVESWVSENTPSVVPLALWMKGVKDGSAAITEDLKTA